MNKLFRQIAWVLLKVSGSVTPRRCESGGMRRTPKASPLMGACRIGRSLWSARHPRTFVPTNAFSRMEELLRLLLPCGALVFLAACAGSSSHSSAEATAAANADEPSKPESGFVSLFDGQTLKGWT